MKFDPTINLGHIAIIVSAVFSVFMAYSSIVRNLDNHELRLVALEKSNEDTASINREVLRTLGAIKEEMSAMKVQLERQR